MILKKACITILFLLSLIVNKVDAQWTQSEQPTGGSVRAIDRVGNDIWAAYLFGIYTSSNEGVTWNRHPDQSLWLPTLDIEVIGDTVILLIQERPSATVYNLSSRTSFDGGVTWNNPVIIETGGTYYTWGARELYTLDSALVLNSNGDDFYVSYNRGITWSTLTFPGNWDLIAHNNKYLISTNPLSPMKGRYFTDNGGQSWNFIDSVYQTNSGFVIDSTFFFVNYIFDTTTYYSIVRTSDFGVTFDTLSITSPSQGQIRFFNGKLYYSYWPYPLPAVVYESTDLGDTWTLSNVPEAFYWLDEEYTVLLNNWEWLVIGSGGLYRYNASTQAHYKTQSGIRAVEMDAIFENKGVLFSKSDYTLFRSSNAGASWSPSPDFIDGQRGFEFLGDTIYGFTRLGGGSNNLCFSFDNGLTWDSVFTAPQQHWVAPVAIRHFENKLYVANQNYISVSSDWGVTWDSISTSIDTTCSSSSFYPEQLVVCNGQLFAHNTGARGVLQLDTLTWTWKKKLCYSAPGVVFQSLYSYDNKLILSAGSNFMVSSDTGKTWTSPSRIGFPSTSRPRGLYSRNGVWFAASGNIYYSFNSGNNWQPLGVSPGMTVISGTEPSFTFLNEIMYASGNNIWWNTDTLDLISGHVYVDWNNNAVKDGSEPFVPNHLLYTTPNNVAFTTDSTGFYQFLTAATGDTLKPSYPTIHCSSNPGYYLTNGNATNIDFGLYVPQNIQDLKLDITNRNPFRPGFNTIIDADVKNLGSVVLSGQIQMVKDSNLVYVSASIPPVSVTGDTLIFNTDTLQFLESHRISIELLTPFTDTIGTPINCYAVVMPVTGDTLPSNNYSDLSEVVVGSFDPNDKSANHDPYFTPQQLQNGDEMIYTVRFQNTGNFPADFVVIVDTLSMLADLSTFRVISTSHDMNYSFSTGRVVTFRFDNINLPPEVTDEPNSHGYVKFGLRFFRGLPVGTGIDNTAYIYFDFNPPIITNTVSTLIADPPLNVNVAEVNSPATLLVFPNPVAETLNIRLEGSEHTDTFNLIIVDQTGRVVVSTEFSGTNFKADVSHYANGIYAGRLISSDKNLHRNFRFVVKH